MNDDELLTRRSSSYTGGQPTSGVPLKTIDLSIWEADEFFRQPPEEEPEALPPPLPPLVLRYNPAGMTRRLLDMGEFDTPEANAYREANPVPEESALGSR